MFDTYERLAVKSPLPLARVPAAASLEHLLARTVEGRAGCLLWQGSFARKYGTVRFRGRVWRAHRVAYELAFGPIPTGLDVMHLCDVGACINPDHLEAGTHRENMLHYRDVQRGTVVVPEPACVQRRFARAIQGSAPTQPVDRFWQRVDRSGECWEWRGQRQRQGYGQVGWAGKRYSAHRFAWLLVNGPIPDGLLVCHRCDTPSCVRPDHLFLGTTAENARDRENKGRGKHDLAKLRISAPKLRGERNPSAKLTSEQVGQIRQRYVPRRVSMKRLADEYCVSPATVFLVVHGATWSSIDEGAPR
jgi:hypothetical protein